MVASPTVFKRYVALQLRALREAAGLRREEVAVELGCTAGHVRHLETLVSLPKLLEIRAMLPLYGAPERTKAFEQLVDAARRGKDWWVDFPGVPSWLELLLSMEAAAVTIHSYDAMVVGGLLQTPAYAAAVIRGGEPDLPEDEVMQRVELRLARQDMLTRRSDSPQVWYVLDESVLYRQPEDPAVLADQVKHLIKMSELPNVHIQVLPFDGLGLHDGINGSFNVLTFGPELVGDPGVAYTETRITGIYYEKPAEILQYRNTWSRVQLLAHKLDESRALLARRLEEIST